MGETRSETDPERSSNAGATGPGAAGCDGAAASEGRFLRRWLAFSARRERRLEQTGRDPDPRLRSPTNARSSRGTAPRWR